MTQEQYDQTNISVLNISTKTKNNLKYLGIHTFKDLHDADLMNNYDKGRLFSHGLKRRILDSVKEFMINASE